MVVRVLSRRLEELGGEGRSYQPSFHQRETYDRSLEGLDQNAFPCSN
jgi:hypothetical protein